MGRRQMRGFRLFENSAGILLLPKTILIKSPFGMRFVNIPMPTHELSYTQYEICVITVTN